ncbi:MAG: hypothetical protein ACJAVR_001807 [Paracoccaceae bacterium]|jgi:hypothetical protein
MINGIYTAYMTGTAGNSIAMLVLLDGKISGADVGGGLYDGNYTELLDGKFFDGMIVFNLPSNMASISGIPPQEKPLSVNVPIHLPVEMNPEDFYRLETPIGPINLRMVKVKDL